MANKILELKEISKTYTGGGMDVPVLDKITFEVDEGEFVAIMGPSGSGKSTLMNIIGCLDRQTSGEYFLDGKDVSKMDDNELADLRNQAIGFVFQNFNLLPHETALENVMLPLLYAGVNAAERKARAEEALKSVGLEDRMSFDPTKLSGGQKQRVAVARAMINHPRILLADEPTGALDSKSGDQLMELFRKLNEDGMTIVMITHELAVAKCAKRILDLKDGKLQNLKEGDEA
ncbi:MAG: ABC transporter ATP-binding protein [Erysipelotrichales bacterium]|nr:ABC transporter ATP-binding protein [Erysipelotrichales bacterium]